MRKILAVTLLAGVATLASVTPASAGCVEIIWEPVITSGSTEVKAPNDIDTNPRDCLTTVSAILPGGGR